MMDDTRLLPLTGGFNLRDFGGYATADGRRVKSGMLYRSGTMFLLTGEDEAHLAALGIATICDFRRSDERRQEPTRWHGEGTEYWSRDYHDSTGTLSAMITEATISPARIREFMIELYRDIPTDHAPAYRAMFDRLASGQVPLLINCAAGKDRTGVGAALILNLLGVPRETIVADYLLTNQADFGRLLSRKGTTLARFAHLPAETIRPVLAAEPAYLDAMFAKLDRSHGGIDGYLADVIGVDADARERIRSHLLED